ncbi:MAG TPA: benzoate-CoA ligase family protein [Acidimicrobiia bacterium]|nr:benzoate-CoA ligase family protein [Acidimicrobiia bacterium]
MPEVDLPTRLNIDERLLGARVEEGDGDREALRLDSRSLSYGEVDDLARRYGVALRSLGVQPEQRVLLALPDGPDYVGALFGILRIGAVAVMVNPDLEADAMRSMIDRSRAPVAVAHVDRIETMDEALGASEWATTQLLAVGGEVAGHPAFSDLDTSGHCDRFETHRDDPAIWLFSGGTTGLPKAVPQTHRSYANTTALYTAAVGYRPEDVTMAVPKLYFGYATGANLFFPFSVGAVSVLFPEPPTPEALYDRIERHRPTILVHVPSAINQMLADPRAETADLSSLRFVTSAGEALPETLYRAWMDRFGVEILDGLGTAEMWHIFVTNIPGDVRPGTLGRVVPGFEVAVRDEEGQDLPEGEVGRLWVRGNSRGLGYWQDQDATAEVFRGEWVVGGDLVSRDADGYFTHRGRADDAVKVKGKWFRPQELESCLLEHPAVGEVAAVPVEDKAGLLRPVAFVVKTEDVTEDALKEWVLGRLEAYKHPRRVVFVEALPQTHLGKVDRGALRRLL